MSSSCPVAPLFSSPLDIQLTELPKGKVLFRFHKNTYQTNSFNPNTGGRIEVPEDGSRFNPFPGAPARNIPTLYAADTLTAAALESVFHNVEHVPSPTFLRSQLAEWRYSKLRTTRKLVLLKLVNPQLRQLRVAERATALTERELIHTPSSEYPHTRTWAQSLHAAISSLDGLAWRPRLGGTGLAFLFFGDRCRPGDLKKHSAAVEIASGPGFAKIHAIAGSANITILDL